MQRIQSILIATPLYPPEIGGPATYTKALEAELPKHGVGITIVKWSDTAWWPPILRHLAYFIKVHDAASDADIIYAQDPLAVGLPALWAARLLRKRFFLKVVGDRAWEEGQRGTASTIDPISFQQQRAGIVTGVRKSIERYVAKRAEKVIVPSEYLQRVILLWGVDPARIHVIRNGLPPLSFPTRAEVRQALSIDPEQPIVVSMGRFSPWKGFPALIASFVRIRLRMPEARLVIIGGGTRAERTILEKEIEKHNLEEHVSLAGILPREQLLAYLAACDLFVLNTLYEGFSHQILEAMAAGAPVITTNVGGNAEIIRDGENACVVPWNDDAAIAAAILRLLNDHATRGVYAVEGRKEAAKYTESRMVEELVALF